MNKICLLLLMTMFCLLHPTAQGALVITAQEVNSTVVFTWSGSLNTTGVGYAGTNIPSIAGGAGSGFGGFFGYSPSTSAINLSGTGILTPTSLPFGTSVVFTAASSATGTPFGLDGSGRIGVPAFYISNSALNGTLTFLSSSFASLGLTGSPVPFIWTLPSADTISMTIGVVPEPSKVLLFAVGMGAVALRRGRTLKCC
jgi:hypothetical protein